MRGGCGPSCFLVSAHAKVASVSDLAVSLLTSQLIVLSTGGRRGLRNYRQVMQDMLGRGGGVLGGRGRVVLTLAEVPCPSAPARYLQRRDLVTGFGGRFRKLACTSNGRLGDAPMIVRSSESLRYDRAFGVNFRGRAGNPSRVVTGRCLSLFTQVATNSLAGRRVRGFSGRGKVTQLCGGVDRARGTVRNMRLTRRTVGGCPGTSRFCCLLTLGYLGTRVRRGKVETVGRTVGLLPLPCCLVLGTKLLCGGKRERRTCGMVLPVERVSPRTFCRCYLTGIAVNNFPRGRILRSLGRLGRVGCLSPRISGLVTYCRGRVKGCGRTRGTVCDTVRRSGGEPIFCAALTRVGTGRGSVPLFCVGVSVTLDGKTSVGGTVSAMSHICSGFGGSRGFVSLLGHCKGRRRVRLLGAL